MRRPEGHVGDGVVDCDALPVPKGPAPGATHSPPAHCWIVNVPSPYPRERRGRLYGPFDSGAAAKDFAVSLPSHWRAEVRPVKSVDAVREP